MFFLGDITLVGGVITGPKFVFVSWLVLLLRLNYEDGVWKPGEFKFRCLSF